jgi:hypothetical protein
MTQTQAAGAEQAEHRIPAPSGAREPLKANIYELMRNTSTQLVPLFPYFGPGAMLPAGALFHGSPGTSYGRFFHRNTEEEVYICFGAQGALAQAGGMFIQGKMHEVQSPLLDPNDPSSFVVSVITQRQADDGDQQESLTFRCSECNNKLFQFEYRSTPADGVETHADVYGGRDDDAYPMFPTQWGSYAAAEAFNADERARTCSKCGHVNDPFPLDRWGWERWVRHHEVVNAARRLLDESARGAESASAG